ncbi:MAG: hypothetical protein ACYTGZ_11960 [Planctomycetota bacterium]
MRASSSTTLPDVAGADDVSSIARKCVCTASRGPTSSGGAEEGAHEPNSPSHSWQMISTHCQRDG